MKFRSLEHFTALSFAAVRVLAASENLPPLPHSSVTTVDPPRGPQTGFIHTRDGALYTPEGEIWNFATFNSPFLLGSPAFEIEDGLRTLRAFARPVTRTYVQTVQSINVPADQAFIQAWDAEAGDWVYNEAMYVQFDQMVDMAAQYDVKIVHPIINQDYGSQDSNFDGNWADLIRLRYNLTSYNQTQSIDWWTDETMISSYKKLIKHFLTRRNTVNGRSYGNDPTFLAFETGNEMNDGGTSPPPGNWTVTIAEYIKSLAPNTMVLDGSFARSNFTEDRWDVEALKSPAVDLHSYHYYRDNPVAYDYRLVNNDTAWVRSFGKTFIAGEHGFYANVSEFQDFFNRQKEAGCAGSMVWSIRPHSSDGGFLTHSEGDGIFSYHAPGWSPPPEADFDPLEEGIIHTTRQASYTLLNEKVPADFPIPNAPVLSVVTNSTLNQTGLTWLGGAWAQHYELWTTPKESSQSSSQGGSHGSWTLVDDSLLDDVDSGTLFYPLNVTIENHWLALRGVSVNGTQGPFSEPVSA